MTEKPKGAAMYRWNRNASTHASAILRFSIFSFVYSVFVGGITVLTMALNSDGQRDYIHLTALFALIAMVVSFACFLVIMTVMYYWVNEESAKLAPEQKPIQRNVYYQATDTGWKLDQKATSGKTLKKGDKVR